MEATVEAAIDVVWRFLTVERAAWWPDLRFEARVGAALIETWNDDGREASATGIVTRCAAPTLLAFRWSEPSWEHPLEVVIHLVGRRRSTSVTIHETGFVCARTPASLPDEHEEGWQYHLARWKSASEAHAADATAL